MKHQVLRLTKQEASENFGLNSGAVWAMNYGAMQFYSYEEDGETDINFKLNILNPVGFLIFLFSVAVDILWLLPLYGLFAFFQSVSSCFFSLKFDSSVDPDTIKVLEIHETNS